MLLLFNFLTTKIASFILAFDHKTPVEDVSVKARLKPILGILAFSYLVTLALPGFSQGLPPTNMGKYVHQPGDNQYSDQTQATRHAPPPKPVQMMSPMQMVPMGYMRTPAPPTPDPSIEPIACDEPIPPPGFPPLPDRLELPIASGGNWSSGGSSFKSSGAAQSDPTAGVTYHQHYGHLPAGAHLRKQQMEQGGGQDSNGGGAPIQQSGYKVNTPSHSGGGANGGQSYYKAKTPTRDYYSAGGSGGDPANPPPKYTGASSRDLRNLGREPRLNTKEEADTPEAPTPVVVTQSTTQDLSLPEDEDSYKFRRTNSTAKKFGRSVGRMGKQMIQSGRSMGGF